MIPGRVRRTFQRPEPAVVQALASFPTGVVSDAMNRLGSIAGLRPLTSSRTICGPALTVEETEAGNLMSHIAIELIEPGDVLVIDAKGVTTRSAWGGIQTVAAQQRGAAGIIVSGAVRDLDEIEASGLPVFALGTSPGGPLKRWGGNINYPISCGGTVVDAGDLIVGDADGLVVVPAALAAELPTHCDERGRVESEWTMRAQRGDATIDVIGQRSAVDELGLRYFD